MSTIRENAAPWENQPGLTEADVRRIVREELRRTTPEQYYMPCGAEWECACGAVVADRAMHDAWHDRTA